MELEFSRETRAKAQALLQKGPGWLWQDPEYPTIWWVQGASTDKVYRIQVERHPNGTVNYATCTCAHGLNNGGAPRCYHVAAVLGKIGADLLNSLRVGGGR